MDSFDDPSEMTPEQRLAELADILASAFEPRGFPRFSADDVDSPEKRLDVSRCPTAPCPRRLTRREADV